MTNAVDTDPDDDGDDSWIDDMDHRDLCKALRRAYAESEWLRKVGPMRGFIEASELLERNGPESVWNLADQYKIQLEVLKRPE